MAACSGQLASAAKRFGTFPCLECARIEEHASMAPACDGLPGVCFYLPVLIGPGYRGVLPCLLPWERALVWRSG